MANALMDLMYSTYHGLDIMGWHEATQFEDYYEALRKGEDPATVAARAIKWLTSTGNDDLIAEIQTALAEDSQEVSV